jgi:hypothetical protein
MKYTYKIIVTGYESSFKGIPNKINAMRVLRNLGQIPLKKAYKVINDLEKGIPYIVQDNLKAQDAYELEEVLATNGGFTNITIKSNFFSTGIYNKSDGSGWYYRALPTEYGHIHGPFKSRKLARQHKKNWKCP